MIVLKTFAQLCNQFFVFLIIIINVLLTTLNFAMKRVEEALAGETDFAAAFICVLSLAWPDGHVESFEGRVDGALSFPPRGDKGFGYDPIFVANGYDLTFAEMEPHEKHAISHRADAFQKLLSGCFQNKAA